MFELISLAVVAFIVLLVVGIFVWRWKVPPKLNQDYFQHEWKELQKLLKNRDRWDVALVRADKLFDIALKKNRFRGATMGERMVKAQRMFSDNDGAWFAHKLRKEVESDPEFKLTEKDLKKALVAIRQVLKDLGALPK